ncbi:cytochrome P450 [Zychaea mexicana]|uniref:cytochrome P450 n=1 Tax=Zychaea mexicana TaxID=64656 RepID=UPI0022FE0842|nr:cytochrome P450 [Zychaea mexicana]KAI9499056.1 cytochrome P450 [Zychaea mexicana]
MCESIKNKISSFGILLPFAPHFLHKKNQDMDLQTISQNFESSANYIVNRVLSTNRQDVKTLGKVVAITLAAYIISSKLYDAFLGPLSGIPGPIQLKLFSLRFSREITNPPGRAYEKFQRWQNQYGDVVRLGPKSIQVADKHMVRQVLFKDDLPKGPDYERMSRDGGPTLLSATDKVFHKQRRRVVSPAFSVKYLNSLEPYMLNTADTFIRSIDREITNSKRSDGYGQVDIWILLHYLALDIIGETAFGQTFHLLDGDDHIVPATIARELETVSYIMTHPVMGLIKALLSFSDLSKNKRRLKEFMTKSIMERLKGGEKDRRNDILQILIDTQHANETEDRLTAEAIAQETILFLVAGSETTSNTIGFAIIELLKNPHALATLRKEVDSIESEDGQKLFTNDQLKQLPYLNAIINETMRINPIAVVGLERITDRDTILAGRLYVPKGTQVRCNIYSTHLNPKYWPEPTKFKPERWLDDSDIPADQEAFYPFSAGSRNCIGKGFAQQEMRLTIASLVRLYDFEAIPAEMKASDERTSFVTLSVQSNSFKLYMKRRGTA